MSRLFCFAPTYRRQPLPTVSTNIIGISQSFVLSSTMVWYTSKEVAASSSPSEYLPYPVLGQYAREGICKRSIVMLRGLRPRLDGLCLNLNLVFRVKIMLFNLNVLLFGKRQPLSVAITWVDACMRGRSECFCF